MHLLNYERAARRERYISRTSRIPIQLAITPFNNSNVRSLTLICSVYVSRGSINVHVTNNIGLSQNARIFYWHALPSLNTLACSKRDKKHQDLIPRRQVALNSHLYLRPVIIPRTITLSRCRPHAYQCRASRTINCTGVLRQLRKLARRLTPSHSALITVNIAFLHL